LASPIEAPSGKITEDEGAFDLMHNIAADENHHFVFERFEARFATV
jgi:hypothetical protein